MKKTLKTGEIVNALNALNAKTTKLGKMKDADRNAVVRTICAGMPIVTAYAEYEKTARERLKGEDYDDYAKKADKFEELSTPEKSAVNRYFVKYENSVNDCMMQESATEKEVEVFPLSADGFGKFMASNEEMSAGDFAAVYTLIVK